MVKNYKKESINTLVNRNLYIKVYGNGYNQLVGVPGLRHILGDILCNKVLEKGLNSDLDKVVLKFRRGLTVTIYAR